MENEITILVVDDIPLMRTMLVKYVQTLGKKIFSMNNGTVEIKVIEAPNGKIALDKLKYESISIIFLDLMMPEMDGLTFLSTKKRIPEYENIPVIVCSAIGEDAIVKKAKNLGASSYITKPFKLKDLEVEFRKTASKYFAEFSIH